MKIIDNVTKLVKPSTPTPSTLSKYNLSFFDGKYRNVLVSLVLYYSTPQKEQEDIQTNIFNHLEISLSKTLTDFYPLAGRYADQASFIDCMDQGALYVQGKANFRLSEYLGMEHKLKLDMVQDFLPCDGRKVAETDHPLLSVKVTAFECGGVAIGMCISHKFGDMDTFCTFIDNWATRTQETGNELVKYSPISSASHLFPITTTDVGIKTEVDPNTFQTRSNCALRVFSFKGSAITKLRDELMRDDHDNIISHRPSKVQLILALLWKALIDIDTQNGESKASTFGQVVNLRNLVDLQEKVYGNLIMLANARIEANQVIDLHVILKILQESIDKMKTSYAKALLDVEKDYEALSKPLLETSENRTNNDVNAYFSSSWCKFSFYNADFGWGKPVWRSTINTQIFNFVILMDDEQGDGVEAWVHLDETKIYELEKDHNIQLYMDV